MVYCEWVLHIPAWQPHFPPTRPQKTEFHRWQTQKLLLSSSFPFYLEDVLVCKGCHNITLQTGWFKQQKFTSLQYWRLEVPRSRCQQGWFLLRPLFFTSDSHLLSVFTGSSICVLNSFCTNTIHIGHEIIQNTSIYHNYLCKGPLSKYNYILRY